MKPVALALRGGAAILPQGGQISTEPSDTPVSGPARVVDYDPAQVLGSRGLGVLDRLSTLALGACTQALHAQVGRAWDQDRVGIVSATTAASLASTARFSRDTMTRARPFDVNPLQFPNTLMNAAAGHAAIRFDLRGPNTTIAGGDAAGLQALRYALTLARTGALDHVLVFGAEEITDEYEALHAQSRARDLPPGEGAVALVLDAVSSIGGTAVTGVGSMTVAPASSEQATVAAVLASLRPARDVAMLTTPINESTRAWLDRQFDQVLDLTKGRPFLRSAASLLAVLCADQLLQERPEVTVSVVARGNEHQMAVATVRRVV